MAQLGLGLDLSTKCTRKREFLEEMRRVVPWSQLIALIEPHYPKRKTGRPRSQHLRRYYNAGSKPRDVQETACADHP